MVGRNYTSFYLPLLKLACILLKIEAYNAGSSTREREPLPQSFSTKSSFCSFLLLFSRRCTIFSDLDYDYSFERVLKLQQLLFFQSRTQALSKSSETIDDMKSDSSSDADSSNENTHSSSEENSDNVTFYRWQIVEKKITKSKVDVTFKDAVEMFKSDIKTLKEHIYIERR